MVFNFTVNNLIFIENKQVQQLSMKMSVCLIIIIIILSYILMFSPANPIFRDFKDLWEPWFNAYYNSNHVGTGNITVWPAVHDSSLAFTNENAFNHWKFKKFNCFAK